MSTDDDASVELLGPDRLEAFARFSERTWPDRPATPEFLQWRYLDCPNRRTLVLVRGGECVATLSAFERPYRWAGRSVTCLETHDWFLQPGMAGTGYGRRVMTEMMAQGLPIVAAGGTQDTRDRLPKLGWTKLADIGVYRLPLGGSVVAGALPGGGRAAEVLGDVARVATRAGVRAYPVRRPDGAEVVPVSTVGDEILPLYDEAVGVQPVAHIPFLRWLTSGLPGMGQFLFLHVIVHGRLRGWALGRAFATEHGVEAQVSDLHIATPEPELLRWVVHQLVVRLVAFGPDIVTARAGAPDLGAALRANGFLHRFGAPAYGWDTAQLGEDVVPRHWTLNSADMALAPYPRRWPPVT